MKLILCIETGTDICSVALSSDGNLLSLRESGEGRSHAQNLAVYVDEILHENDLACSDLAAVAVSMGPGSYTGLRIGSSLAKGICYAEGIPLIAVSTLEALAVGAIADFEAGLLKVENLDHYILAPMIDARRMEVYTQLFTHGCKPLNEVTAEVISGESFAAFYDRDFILFGDGAKKCVDVLNVKSVVLENIAPSARNMTKLAYDKYLKGEFVDIAYFEPLYLKDFIGTTKKKNPFDMPKQRKREQ